MAKVQCPTPAALKRLIAYYGGEQGVASNAEEQEAMDNALEAAEALRYLQNSLDNRRLYQKKQQIKRKLLFKLADEQGLMAEIDDAARKEFGDDLEKMTLGEDEDES